MEWTPQQICWHFHDNEAFVANYCRQFTFDQLQNEGNRQPGRLIAKRLAQLMPHGAHNSPGFGIVPCPFVTVSRFTGAAGLMHSDRVAAFQTNNEFFIGFRCDGAADGLNGINFPQSVRNALNEGHYEWMRFNQPNDHLCIQVAVPEQGHFIGDHPLADHQPLALALQWINENIWWPVERDHPEWYQNFLTARGQPPEGVITPRVMSYKLGDNPGIQLPDRLVKACGSEPTPKTTPASPRGGKPGVAVTEVDPDDSPDEGVRAVSSERNALDLFDKVRINWNKDSFKEGRMEIPNEVAVQRYNMVREEVRTRCPEIWNIVVQLCSAVPDRIETGHIWQFGRDKPCWSNITVATGERIAADIGGSEDFNSCELIAGDAWEIVMLNRGPNWKRNENFELRGNSVQEFVRKLTGGGLSSYLWRLYAIRNLALALTRDAIVQDMVTNLTARGCIPSDELREWTTTFCNRVGMGWGVVTVYHMLADLGLTPKPDMWLNRSVIKMGLLSPQWPSNSTEGQIDRADVHAVVVAGVELSELIVPTAFPEKPQSCVREVDKVLMEWSRQGLARPL